MPKLNVNIDHVATLRQARGGREPDPIHAACIAELAGASGIVAHLREDRRHIQDSDMELLRRVVTTKLNMEMAPTEEMVSIALAIRPDVCTLVPERRQEVTTEGGLEVTGALEAVRQVVARLKGGGIEVVSLFIDPDTVQVESAVRAGADMVEIHTGRYAEASNDSVAALELDAIRRAVDAGLSAGLRVAAGHGLNYHNVSAVAAIEGVEELNIGHSIVAKSVFVGMERAVREMVALCLGCPLRSP